MTRSVGVALATAGAALLVAGCGSSSGGQATSTEGGKASPAEWANGVCQSLVTWRSRIAGERTQLSDGAVSKDALRKAADGVASANDKLKSDLDQLGKPPGEPASKTKAAAESLADSLQAEQKSIEDALKGVSGASDFLRAASEITGSLATMGDELAAAAKQVESAARTGGSDWQRAFSDSEACKKLSNP
jgi:hypothetical protein